MVRVFRFSPDGSIRRFDDLPGAGWVPDGEDSVWVDLEAPTDDELTILTEPFHFHPLAIEDCLTPEHQPKVEDFGATLFMIFRGIDSNPPVSGFQTHKLAAFLGANYLVTYHRLPMRSVAAVEDRYDQESGHGLFRRVDHLLYEILDHLIEHYFPVLDGLEEEIDAIEEELLGDCGPATLDKVLTTKRRVQEIKRALAPHREVFTRIGRDTFPVIAPQTAVFYRDLYDSTARLSETADSYRDLLTTLFDAYLSVVSQRINEVMKVLTVIATVVLPLTFIVGIYGMNFDHMPELHWRYGYFAVWGVMIAVAAGLLWGFRRRGWI
ncbi:MAG TPA: magnesium/cobalt transporter CorA [Gemmatimonadota bacterium]|jgi:magnesium transporter|nr:magnesium/cobalt transporter CorA [Gemmatimonadota bacterium]